MPNKQYPELKCVGYKKEDCDGIVVSKKLCLCNNCYSRMYYHERTDEAKKEKRKHDNRVRYYLFGKRKTRASAQNENIFIDLGNQSI